MPRRRDLCGVVFRKRSGTWKCSFVRAATHDGLSLGSDGCLSSAPANRKFVNHFFHLCDAVPLSSEVSDHPLENLIPYFPISRNFIDQALSQGGRVFIHCNGGISRAPAFAIAYLMESQGLDFATALNHVQARRFCMNMNDGFKMQLKVRFNRIGRLWTLEYRL